MAKETIYGIISDIHNSPEKVIPAIEILRQLGAQKLIINGDISNQKKTLEESQYGIARVLNYIGMSELEAYVQPGGHESFLSFDPVIDYLTTIYPNLVDATKIRKVYQNNHTLVFLPGSDYLATGEYFIGKSKKTGKYMKTNKGLKEFNDIDEYFEELNKKNAKGIKEKDSEGIIAYYNMKDLEHLVDDPERTILICHVPRKFYNLDNCVDMAEFGEAKEDFIYDGKTIRKGSIFSKKIAQRMEKAGFPIELKKENRGNEDLKEIYEKIGINKAISGHFHESAGRANDTMGNHVRQKEEVKELFWNASYLEGDLAGILSVNDSSLIYMNVNLKDYLR
ncbi:MAG: hypothetical protein PWR30_26 [Candidatus Woesearchaeota archaeon]|nr:hypothetical protein [Candidatus Woesearchaeota archaeon]